MDIYSFPLSADQIRSIRRDSGMTQQQFAEAIGVAKVTVARWESGSRRCRTDYAKRVRKLAAEQGAETPRTTTLFHLKAKDLDALDATAAVEALRDLLWCECTLLGLPRSEVHVGIREIADGGIDAVVPAVPNPTPSSSLLFTGANYFQVKAGSSWKPWQPSFAKKELTDKKGHLKRAVEQCLSNEGRYVLVCFGTDLNHDQRTISRENIEAVFARAGYAGSKVDVWGQQELIGLISRFPSLSLRLSRRDDLQLQSWSSWNTSSDMSTSLMLGDEQDHLIDDIRRYLRGNDVAHVRVFGEPGLGKTRLVHEALSADDLAPNVVYVQHTEDFQRSRLFNYLLRPELDCFVILALDECRPRECAEVWNRLSNHWKACRVVSMDHDPYQPGDSRFVELECPKLKAAQIAEVIGSYTTAEADPERWAELCSGSPRVAHAIGLNLKTNPTDMLRAPSMELVWERVVSRYQPLNNPSTREKLTVLRGVALFERFGFESPVHDEAEFIADLVHQIEPNITPARFQQVVCELKQQRILQGQTTLFIAPKLLHIHLWQQFWELHGRDQSLSDLIKSLPKALMGWFARMFSYASESRVASEHVKRLLGTDGPFSDPKFALSDIGCHFLHELANASPTHTLACLERVIGSLSRDELLSFDQGRQRIVWALERIAMWPTLFCRAAILLRTLAEAENASNSNNSTGTFVGLFCLAPGRVAPTGAAPDERVPLLEKTLNARSPETKKLGVKACGTALSLYTGSRLIGPEYQGLKTVEPWTPDTWSEVHEARGKVWDLLFESSRAWNSAIRSEANRVLTTSALGLLHISSLAERVLKTLETLLDDSATDLRQIVDVIARIRRHGGGEYESAVLERLQLIDARITGTDFSDRLNRVVHLGGWDDYYDDEGRNEKEFHQRVVALASEAAESDERFQEVLPELVRGTNNVVFHFGRELARHDSRQHLRATIDGYRTETNPVSTLFISGYLATVFETDPPEWERIVEELLRDDAFTQTIGTIVRNSGATDNVILRLIAEYDSGRLDISCLQALGYSHFLKELREDTFLAIVGRLRRANEISYALELLDFVYCGKDEVRPLPEEETLVLLCAFKQADSRNQEADHNWSVVAEQFIDQFPSQQIELFEAVLTKLIAHNWHIDEHNPVSSVIQAIIRVEPDKCWGIVTARLALAEGAERYRLLRWLGPGHSFGGGVAAGPLALFPMNAVFDWIAEDPEERAYEVATIVPKTLARDEDGKWARQLLDRYGDLEDVRRGLMSHFWADGWMGPASDHYRKKRDTAREWLDSERSLRVRQWIEQYIDWLSADIERAEIEEERRF